LGNIFDAEFSLEFRIQALNTTAISYITQMFIYCHTIKERFTSLTV